MKRMLAFVLCVLLCVSPLSAFAEAADASSQPWMGYSSALELFYFAVADQWGIDRLTTSGFDAEEFPKELEKAGFLLRDLNGDETYELLMLKMFETELSPVICVYTLKDGKPVRLLSSYARARFFVLQDGRVYLERDDSAVRSQYCLYTLKDGKLVMDEAVYFTDYEKDGETLSGWFKTTDDKHRYAIVEESLIDEETALAFRQAAEELVIRDFTVAYPLAEYNP